MSCEGWLNRLHDLRKRRVDDIVIFCETCEKKTPHVSVSGHDGMDSYSYVECLTCGTIT